MKNRSAARAKTGLMIAVILVLIFVAACGNGNNTGKNTDSSPAPSGKTGTSQNNENTPVPQAKPLEIDFMNVYFTAEPPKADNPALKFIQEKTNTKLNMIWVPDSAYVDKINITLASNSLPHLLVIQENKQPTVISSVRAGMFWELGPYLKDHPNLSKLNPDLLRNISVDGKVYGIYRQRDLSRGGLIYRQDWLDKVGMKPPVTLDDFYKMLQAFTNDDPDGNGQQDTVGLTLSKNLRGDIKNFKVWFGAPKDYEEKDGKITPDFLTQEFLDMMNFLRKAYAEKLINADFPIVPDAKDPFKQQKAGSVFYCMCDVPDGIFDDIVKNNANAKIDFTNLLEGPKGRVTGADQGYNGVFMIPKTSVKTEDELKQILTFLDTLAGDEISSFLDTGVDGVHSSIVDGKIVRTEEYSKDLVPFNQMRIVLSKAPPADEVYEKLFSLYAENEKVAIHSPVLPFTSKTVAEKGTQLTQIITDAMIKYIMGQIDEAKWNAALEEWKKTGGLDLIHDYEVELANARK